MTNANQEYITKERIEEPVIKIYAYGSRVYGCNTELSDYDYIVVVDSENDDLVYSVNFTNMNMTVYSKCNFIKRIKEHEVNVLECIFQDENDEFLQYFKLNTEKLRRRFSAVASNSYVKCKKKLKEEEFYIGKKSLYHSLRILNFGIQIAKYGKITDYSVANVYHKMIFKMGDEWSELDAKFKPVYNAKKSLFKKLAPLESENEDGAK